MNAALYLRISLDVTGQELGVTRQREDCISLAAKRGWTVVADYTDNDTSASGKVMRPQFEKLLDAVAAGQVDVIIAWNLDRITRSRRDTVRLIESCQERKVIISLARGSDLDMSTPMGRMMADQLAGWARYEIEQSGDRQRRANAQRAAKGIPHGSRRPFGYEADLVTIHEPEAVLLRHMASQVIAGFSYKHIAWQLNEAGHRTTKGRLFYPVTIRNMLRKPRYGGIRDYKGQLSPGSWPAIFDPATWERLTLTMKLRQAPSDTPKSRKYLLTGLVYCGNCGMPLNGSAKRDRPDSPIRRAYICRSLGDAKREHGCGRVRRGAEPLDDYIKELVLYRLDTPELASLLGSDDDGQLTELLAERQLQRLRHDGLTDDYASGLLDKSQFARASATSKAELDRLDRDIETARRKRLSIEVKAGESVRQAWDAGDDEWRRGLLRLLIKRIDVQKGATKRVFYKGYRFDPTKITVFWLD